MKAQRPDMGMPYLLSAEPRELETGSTGGSSVLAIVDRGHPVCVAGKAGARFLLLPPVPPPPQRRLEAVAH